MENPTFSTKEILTDSELINTKEITAIKSNAVREALNSILDSNQIILNHGSSPGYGIPPQK